MLSPTRPPTFYSLVRCASLALSLSVLVWSAGCSKGAKDSVTGKVTLNGQKVTGTLTFTGPDKKSVTAPINPDGTYLIENPSKGDNTITVQGLGTGPGAAPANTFAPVTPDKGADLMKDKSIKGDTMGSPPPTKYATEAGGLKYTVKGGKETHNIELTP
jgi:hypothetical protein